MTKLIHLLCALALLYNGWSVLFAYSNKTSENGSFERGPNFMTELAQEFEKFKRVYNRVYKSEDEKLERSTIFAENYIFVKEMNTLYEQGKSSYKVGINRFSDISNDERKARKCIKQTRVFKSRLFNVSRFYYGFGTTPNTVDWRDHNYVTPVKDQGECGGCYAFSATGSLEGQHFRKTGILISLSEQQIVDCSKSYGDHGCDGGEIYDAFEYIYKNNGIDTEESYPFISGSTMQNNSRCNFRSQSIGAKIIGYANITPSGDEAMLERAVATIGPISVLINADNVGFRHYAQGVYYHPHCRNHIRFLDHAVLVVGYGVENGIPYWLVKNSWGSQWGMDGYVKMRRNANNMCGIATAPVYPIV